MIFLFVYTNCGHIRSFYRNIKGLIKFSPISLKTQITLSDIPLFAIFFSSYFLSVKFDLKKFLETRLPAFNQKKCKNESFDSRFNFSKQTFPYRNKC